MAKIIITKNNQPTSTEFKALLEEMETRSSPFDDLLSLMRELTAFEQKHQMSSDIFYARFMRGEMGDAMPFIKWAGRYALYLEAKDRFEQQMKTVMIGVHNAEKVLEPAL